MIPQYNNCRFYYEPVVTPLVNSILKSFMRSRLPRMSRRKLVHWPYAIRKSRSQSGDNAFLVVWKKVVNDNIGDAINVEGWATHHTPDGIPRIDIELQTITESPTLEVHAKEIEFELFHVVAHEIHHLTQSGPLWHPASRRIEKSTPYKSYAEYFMSPEEVPAFLIGFRAQAEKANMSVNEVSSRYLSRYIELGCISKEDAKSVIDTWVMYEF